VPDVREGQIAVTTLLDNILAKQNAPAHDHHQFSEIRRIVTMPVWGGMTDVEYEEYNRLNVNAQFFSEGWRLFNVQADAVAIYEATGGLLAPVKVGGGKTLISLMVAEKAYRKGIEKILLIVPPEILPQLLDHDIRWARPRVSISYPIFSLGGRTSAARRALAYSNKKGLYILPYSLLSVKDTEEVLNAIHPGLIIADEGHRVAKFNAARTRRLRNYIEDARPEFAVMSGTVTSKSIQDFWHLAKWSLGDNNPLPNATSLAMEWAAVIDATAETEGFVPRGMSAAMMPLVHWAAKNFPGEYPETVKGFREAFQKRLMSAPGVVTGGGDIGTSLTLANVPVVDKELCPGWPELDELIKGVTERWMTPNGDEIEHAIHCFKWMYEIAGAGFYNELYWPTPDNFAKRRILSASVADEILDKAKKHHVAGQDYFRMLRSYLTDCPKSGMDTPMLVGAEMARNGAANVPPWLYDPWRYWRSLDFTGRPDRDSRAVRVCDYKIRAAVEWVKGLTEPGALIWVWHQEVGKWITEALTAAGIECVHCPAGDAYNRIIIDPANKDKKLVVSIAAHGTGKNLQHFQQQYFLQWPRSAVTAEQALGRTHRSGQAADELVVFTNLTLEFDQCNFASCLNDSLYIHQTTGNRQKLIYASYNPMPKIFPPAVLRERGYSPKSLTTEQQRMMEEKFGTDILDSPNL
jgi:hypothetical protein